MPDRDPRTPSWRRDLGFTAARRRALLRSIGLKASDHRHAADLQRYVLIPHADRITDAFYQSLNAVPAVRRIVAGEAAMAHLWETQRHYLLTLGVGFDTAAYFEGRLHIGAVHARVSVPPSLYQAAYAVLQCLILARVRAQAPPRRRAALTNFVVKIATLDMALAIETYHNLHVDHLRSSIKTLRGRAAVLHRRAETDAFTGVAHHARILAVLARELAAHRGRPLAIIIADLDRFKSINDNFGHLAGDKVLRAVTARIRAVARRDDVVGRYGGDEFMVVLRGASPATARRIAERLRAKVGSEAIDIGGRAVTVTLSAGITVATPRDSVETLVARADAALYQAKRSGRDRVIAATRAPAVAATSAPSAVRPEAGRDTQRV